jgi:hypothetical protein
MPMPPPDLARSHRPAAGPCRRPTSRHRVACLPSHPATLVAMVEPLILLCCVLFENLILIYLFIMSVGPGLTIASKGTRGKD